MRLLPHFPTLCSAKKRWRKHPIDTDVTESEREQRALEASVPVGRRRLRWLIVIGLCLSLCGSCVAIALRERANAQEKSCSYVLRAGWHWRAATFGWHFPERALDVKGFLVYFFAYLSVEVSEGFLALVG